MIQRIQSVYYGLAIVALLVPMLGMDIFSLATPTIFHHVTLFGNEAELLSPDATGLTIPQIPLFWGNLLVVVLLLITFFSYKNLKRQAMLGRFTILVYAAVIVVLGILGFVYTGLLIGYEAAMAPGVGFYCIVIGILLTLLGNRGVKKDRKLLDSLNRLR